MSRCGLPPNPALQQTAAASLVLSMATLFAANPWVPDSGPSRAPIEARLVNEAEAAASRQLLVLRLQEVRRSDGRLLELGTSWCCLSHIKGSQHGTVTRSHGGGPAAE